MSFTRAWDADNPSNSTVANEIDDYMNKLRDDVDERLSDLVYGFSGSENDGNQGLKAAVFRQQGSAPTVSTDEIGLYAYEDSSQCCLYAKEEGGDTRKILTSDGTDITINLLAEDITADLIDDTKINLTNTGYLTGRNNANNGDVNILKVNTSDEVEFATKATLADGSVLAAATESGDGDRTVADKKYVDDRVGKNYRYVSVDGSDTKVFTKYLTGTLDNDAETSVAHGVTSTNILHVSAIVYEDDRNVYQVGEVFRSRVDAREFGLHYDGTNIVFEAVGSAAQGNAYRIKIEYYV